MDSIYFKDPLGLLIELASYRFEPPHGFTHADVLMADGFEADDWMGNWSDHSGDYEVTASPNFGYVPIGEGRALRARIPEGEQTALGTSYRFMGLVPLIVENRRGGSFHPVT